MTVDKFYTENMNTFLNQILQKPTKYIIATLLSPWWVLKLEHQSLVPENERRSKLSDLLFSTKLLHFVGGNIEDDNYKDTTFIEGNSGEELLLTCGLQACCVLDLLESADNTQLDRQTINQSYEYMTKSLLGVAVKEDQSHIIREVLDFSTFGQKFPRRVTPNNIKLLSDSGDSSFWAIDGSSIVLLSEGEFSNYLKSKKHALVIFYSPTCPHCIKAKPEFLQAAKAFKNDNNTVFAAVDCTKEPDLCRMNRVVGYPTMIYFQYSRRRREYEGNHKAKDIINFMNRPISYQHVPDLIQDVNDGVVSLNRSDDDDLSTYIESRNIYCESL